MPTLEEIRALIGAKAPPKVWTPAEGLISVPWGTEGTGKTRFALSFPGPLIIHDLEGNVRETMASMPGIEDKVAAYYSYSVPILVDKDASKPIWQEFHRNYFNSVVALGKAGVTATHIVDSGTRLWELCRYALVPLDADGRVKSAWNYAPANDSYAAIFHKARDNKQNLVMPCRAASVWEEVISEDGRKSVKKTNRFMADWKEPTTAHLASIVVEIVSRLVRTPGNLKGVQKREYYVQKCTPNEALKAEVFDSLDYDTLVAAIASY